MLGRISKGTFHSSLAFNEKEEGKWHRDSKSNIHGCVSHTVGHMFDSGSMLS